MKSLIFISLFVLLASGISLRNLKNDNPDHPEHPDQAQNGDHPPHPDEANNGDHPHQVPEEVVSYLSTLQNIVADLTLKELRDLAQAQIDAYDTPFGEGDGCLTPEEAGTGLVELIDGLTKDSEEYQTILDFLISTADTDKSGCIDAEELARFLHKV